MGVSVWELVFGSQCLGAIFVGVSVLELVFGS